MQNRWMTLQEVAEYLQLSKDLIYNSQSLLPDKDRDRLWDIGISSLPPYRRSPSRRIPERVEAEQHRLIRWWTACPVRQGTHAPPYKGEGTHKADTHAPSYRG